jgi:flavin-dependent dehydrogenase
MEEDEIRKMTSVDGQSNEAAMEFYLGTVDWGYGWCFPKADSVNIGIGCRMDKMENLQSAWTGFLHRIKMEKGIAVRPVIEDTFKVPFGYPEWRLVGRRIMVVGDAAGLASPLTGEGIYYAIVSGSLAADVAVETIESRNPKEMVNFAGRMREKVIPELESAEFITRRLMKTRWSLEIACEVAEEDQVMRELIVEFVVGSKPPQELKSTMLKRMLIHHPLQSALMGLG